MLSSRRRTWFYVGMALVMLACMAVGFAPTFYLRPYFERIDLSGTRELPTHLVIHGFLLTAWFLLFFVQTLLVARGATEAHRRLGVYGGFLAVAVVAASAVTVMREPARTLAAAASKDPNFFFVVVHAFLAGILSLVLFAGFVGLGIYFRRRPATHKRLMLLASLQIIGPAFSIARPLGGALQPLMPFVPVGLAVILLPLSAMFVRDLVEFRRPQRATVWGAVVTIFGLLLGGVLTATDAAQSLVRSLA